MPTLIVSSSRSPESRSNRLANLAGEWLVERGTAVTRLHVQREQLPGFDREDLFESSLFLEYSQLVREADSLILASPVYNWSFCADLKHFIEIIGSVSASMGTPLFDKLVSFIYAAGLPHSYMAFSSLAMPLMMDFRCIINPHQAYLHNRHWDPMQNLTNDGKNQLERMLTAHVDLTQRLTGYSQTTCWQT